jgi:hypothetical protein
MEKKFSKTRFVEDESRAHQCERSGFTGQAQEVAKAVECGFSR